MSKESRRSRTTKKCFLSSKFRRKRKLSDGFTKKMCFFRDGLNLSKISTPSNLKLKPRLKETKSRFLTEIRPKRTRKLHPRPTLKSRNSTPKAIISIPRLIIISKWETKWTEPLDQPVIKWMVLSPMAGEALPKLELIRALEMSTRFRECILLKMLFSRPGTSTSCKISSKTSPNKRNLNTKVLRPSPIRRRRQEFSSSSKKSMERDPKKANNKTQPWTKMVKNMIQSCKRKIRVQAPKNNKRIP